MDYDFYSPRQYYIDFDNQVDDSHPEEYFETRQTRSAFTPFKNILSPIGNVKTEGKIPSLGKLSSSASDGGDDGPYQNTRSCVKNNSRLSERPVKRVSSRFQPSKETSAKKVKMAVPEEVEEVKNVPLPVVNKKRWTAGKRVLKCLRKLKSKRQQKGLSITVPEPFLFQTDKRLKGEAHEKCDYKTVDFATTLRSNKENENHKVVSGPVRPVPERLLRKRKNVDSKTMAEQLMLFQTDLHSNARPESPSDSRGSKCPRVTRPVSPLLRASTRSRPLHILTHEEKEILEAEEMKKYRFKAHPANRKILVPVGIQVKKATKKPQTVKKTATPKPRSKSLERPPQFHARPVPFKILQGVTGLGKKVQVESTEPHSPSFALKRREEIWKKHEEELERREAAEAAALAEAQTKKGRHLRSHSQSLQSSPKEPKRTVPAPFSFQARNQDMLAHKRERIQQILEEESKPHDFKANPMPSPTLCGLPPRRKKPTTKAHNFSFNSDQLALRKAYKWQKQMEEELAEQKRAMRFKANPCTVTAAEPFYPNKATKKPLTEFAEFNLHSETRATLRSKYNEDQKEREAEQEAELEARRLKEEQLAQKEIVALRSKIVHKANPVPHYQTFQVKHGLLPATHPVTPKFATDKRLKRKHE